MGSLFAGGARTGAVAPRPDAFTAAARRDEAWTAQGDQGLSYSERRTSRRCGGPARGRIYKNGVKEIAGLNGISATFMAKPSEKDIGSSCHIHMSLVDHKSGRSAFVDGDEESDVFRHFLGGLRNRVRELALFVSPSVNSYKRYATESWHPPRSRGGGTIARAASASSATGSRDASSAASRAPT